MPKTTCISFFVLLLGCCACTHDELLEQYDELHIGANLQGDDMGEWTTGQKRNFTHLGNGEVVVVFIQDKGLVESNGTPRGKMERVFK